MKNPISPVIILVSILIYLTNLSAGFFSWDDPDMVVRNSHVHALSFHHLLLYFTTPYHGIYQPVTMFLYALEWRIGNGDPFVFHLTGMVVHAISGFSPEIPGRRPLRRSYSSPRPFKLNPSLGSRNRKPYGAGCSICWPCFTI